MKRTALFPLPKANEDLTAVQHLLELHTQGRAALQVGSVRLAAGERVPSEGTSQHPVDEISLIVRGSLRAESAGEQVQLTAGEVTLIPAGEAHWAVAGEEGAEIFWLWFGPADMQQGQA